MASTFSVTPSVGVTFTDRNTTPAFAVGMPVLGNQNDTWVYVKASGAVPAAACTVDGSFNVTSTAGTYTAATAFASGEYGWVYKTTSPL
jgi:hypothetical protein